MESSPHSLLSIASAQDCEGSPEPCDITQVLSVVTLFSEGEYSTGKMIWMLHSLQSSFICPAASSFTLSNITVLTFLSVLFSIRLAHFSNLICCSFVFLSWCLHLAVIECTYTSIPFPLSTFTPYFFTPTLLSPHTLLPPHTFNSSVFMFSSAMARRNHTTTVCMSFNLLPAQVSLANIDVTFGSVLP